MAEGRDDKHDDSLTHQLIDDSFIREIRHALGSDDERLLKLLLTDLHPADMADLLQLLEQEQRLDVIEKLGDHFDNDTYSYLDETVREELVRLLNPDRAVALLSELETDDAVDILADLDQENKDKILKALPLPDRAVLEQGLAFPEYSAGRLMQRDVVAVPDYWVVGQTIDYLRTTPNLPEEFYDIYILDPLLKPVGSVPLSNILRSKRSVEIQDLKMRKLHLINCEQDQEEVAFTFRQYGLVSAPVVDDSGRLLGVITVDDVVDVIQEEAEEDILKLGGVQETDIYQSTITTVKRRVPWLLVNLVTAIIASLVIAQFDAAIEQIVALAVLMPIVASMGGNAGTQTLTVTVRSLAVRELTSSNTLKLLGKEIYVAFANGAFFFLVGIVLALFWFGDALLAAIFGFAMIVNLVAGGFAGFIIPLVLDRLGMDPAVSSGVFLTTVTDVVGFFAFLGLAAYLMF